MLTTGQEGDVQELAIVGGAGTLVFHGSAAVPGEIAIRRLLTPHRRTKIVCTLGPATETLESRVGDCTEHSVLFSALAKASGIPTRLVDGVVVADGRIGYHEWVEVYLKGEGWRAVDPTFGEARAGPNRLKLATGTSQPEELLRMGMSAASALTGLKISVISHERR